MKTNMHKIGLSIAALWISFSVSAYDFEVDGIYYNVASFTDMTCTVTSGETNYQGDITIPAEVTYNSRKLSVTSIGHNAFRDCSALTSITISNSVTTIGDAAFYGCSSLTSITIPNSVTEIGDAAFQYCSSLASITIPNSVTEIGDDAFYKCSSLASITIPNSVTTIGYYAFSGCSSLASITIPNSVTTIGYYAFYGCSALTSITISNSVTTIGDAAFYGCSSLTSITIPNSVTEIGYRAFYKCSSLASITIPNSVTEIGDAAFYKCSSLASITIPNSVTTIGYYAFSGCSSLKSIVLSDNLVSIEGGLFENCSKLESLEIPGSISYISQYYDIYYTFKECTSLKKLRILNSTSELQGGYTGSYGFSQSYWNYNQYNWTQTITYLYINRNLAKNIPVPNLENLEIGESMREIPVTGLNNLYSLQSIKSHAAVPPKLPTMSNKQYMNLNVYVPKEHLAAYQQADGWKNFWNLQGVDFDSIDDCVADSGKAISVATGSGTICIENKPADAIARVYTLQGRLIAETTDSIVSNLPPDLYIITIGSKTFKIKL